MAFGVFMEGFNEQAAPLVIQLLGDNPLSAFIAAHPFWMMLAVSVLIIVFFLFISFFFDFITDVWKIPLGAIVDVGKYLGLAAPWFALASSVAGALLFIVVSDTHLAKIFFALISIGVGLLVFFMPFTVLGVLAAIAPVNTIMIFISTIID